MENKDECDSPISEINIVNTTGKLDNVELYSKSDGSEEGASKVIEFKKPVVLIGPRKGAHKFNLSKCNETENKDSKQILEPDIDVPKKVSKSPAEALQDQNIPLPYKEPKWSCSPNRKYSLEVLKSGTIVETFELTNNFFVFGRAVAANCVLAHPSISRYHAVLQFGKKEDDDTPGFYLYDLSSTHGTFFNKSKIKPHLYVRLQVGHMIKLGLSSRLFILQGPPDDVEPESELTVTELKNIRLREKLAAEFAKNQLSSAKEDEGIDWGMGEDADEETDLSINPFAAAPNEDLYIDDPKKTLRGWFEREGEELVYDCQEKGYGQFVCRVELPIESARGQSIVAEAIVKGKKKEAVVQCALEACRILDQHGLLRQSNHESRKKKAKNWEADDFYDSDEDVFLDRTGTVERKRQKRMQEAGVTQVVHTHAGLLAEHARLVEEVHRVQAAITSAMTPAAKPAEATDDELDRYMADLSSQVVDKGKIYSLKMELARYKQEEVRVRSLANIARTAGTPELQAPWPSDATPAPSKAIKQPPIIGKRRLLSKKPVSNAKEIKPAAESSEVHDAEEEEFDSD